MGRSDELSTRQASLQAEAREVLADLDRAGLFAWIGTPLPTGSFVSGLMVWRDLDLMVLGGADFSPADVLTLLGRAVEIPGVVGFDYRDERGPRRPTDDIRDERYHVAISLQRGDATWRIDLSVWLHDLHTNVTEWHEALRDSITDEQRDAVLLIKDGWHRRPDYPDTVSGLQIYTAVLEHGIRTPDEFSTWLTC